MQFILDKIAYLCCHKMKMSKTQIFMWYTQTVWETKCFF